MNQETTPKGNDTRIQNMTDFTWERLISMRDEAMYQATVYTGEGETSWPEMEQATNALNKEIQRRLLKIIA